MSINLSEIYMERIKTEELDVNIEQMKADNAVSIAAASKKRAIVVVVDPKKLVNKNGESINLFDTKELKQWLLSTYQGRKIKIDDDNQIVQFTRGGIESDLKNRGEIRRQAYANLDSIVESSIYYSYELGDERHVKVNRHKTYYGAVNIGGRYYATRLKIDTFLSAEIGLYKDLVIEEIKSPSLYIGGGPSQGGRTYQDEGDIVTISVPEIIGAFTT